MLESLGLPEMDSPPNYESDTFLVKLFSLIIFRKRLGAKATLIYFPQEISTNLFNNIWLCLFIVTFFSIK